MFSKTCCKRIDLMLVVVRNSRMCTLHLDIEMRSENKEAIVLGETKIRRATKLKIVHNSKNAQIVPNEYTNSTILVPDASNLMHALSDLLSKVSGCVVSVEEIVPEYEHAHIIWFHPTGVEGLLLDTDKTELLGKSLYVTSNTDKYDFGDTYYIPKITEASIDVNHICIAAYTMHGVRGRSVSGRNS